MINDDNDDQLEQRDDVCPRCSSTDITLDHVTLQFNTPLMADGTMDALGIDAISHKNFPILRCNDCGNIALSKSALVKIIPGLEGREFDLMQLPQSYSRSHEWN